MNLIATVDDFSVEPSVPVGVVLDSAHIAIRLDQRVFASYNITVALFLLMLNVTGVWVIDTVFKRISWMIILIANKKLINFVIYTRVSYILT